MTQTQLDKIMAYLDAIMALCGNGDEKAAAIKIIAMDLSNYVYDTYHKETD